MLTIWLRFSRRTTRAADVPPRVVQGSGKRSARPFFQRRDKGNIMWALTTSNGMRVDGIRQEQDGRSVVHMLGYSQVIGPYAWSVVDNQGRQFIAELRWAS